MRTLLIVLCVVVFVFARLAHGEIYKSGKMMVEVRAVDTEARVSKDVTNLRGHTSDLTTDQNNWCFVSQPQNDFKWGQTIGFNTFWVDQALNNGTNTWNLIIAVVLPNGQIFPFYEEDVIIGPLMQDEFYEICAAYDVKTPVNGPPITLDWGSQVTAENGSRAVGILGNLTLE